MALDYDNVMSKVEIDLPFTYTDTESILYALSVGMGRDPVDPHRRSRHVVPPQWCAGWKSRKRRRI